MKIGDVILMRLRYQRAYRVGVVCMAEGENKTTAAYLSKAGTWKTVKDLPDSFIKVPNTEELEQIESLIELGKSKDVSAQSLYIQLTKTICNFDADSKQVKLL